MIPVPDYPHIQQIGVILNRLDLDNVVELHRFFQFSGRFGLGDLEYLAIEAG